MGVPLIERLTARLPGDLVNVSGFSPDLCSFIQWREERDVNGLILQFF